jgi:hypothetical protein
MKPLDFQALWCLNLGEQCPQIAKPISGSEKMQNSQVKPYFQTIKTNKLLNSSESF